MAGDQRGWGSGERRAWVGSPGRESEKGREEVGGGGGGRRGSGFGGVSDVGGRRRWMGRRGEDLGLLLRAARSG